MIFRAGSEVQEWTLTETVRVLWSGQVLKPALASISKGIDKSLRFQAQNPVQQKHPTIQVHPEKCEMSLKTQYPVIK